MSRYLTIENPSVNDSSANFWEYNLISDGTSKLGVVLSEESLFQPLLKMPQPCSAASVRKTLLHLIQEIFSNIPIKMTVKAMNFIQDLIVKNEVSQEGFLKALDAIRLTLLKNDVKPEDVFGEITCQEDSETGVLRVFITFKIKSKNFDELQAIWDELIDEYHKRLPLELCKKIEIEVEPGE